MLVIDGKTHPAFKQGSANLFVRNGVGILPGNKVVFAMSKQPINFTTLPAILKSWAAQTRCTSTALCREHTCQKKLGANRRRFWRYHRSNNKSRLISCHLFAHIIKRFEQFVKLPMIFITEKRH